jgi:hypothetical protein
MVDWGVGLGFAWIIFWIVFMVAMVIGYVLNILHIIHMDIILTGLGIVRLAGIFVPPLGGFMGLFF